MDVVPSESAARSVVDARVHLQKEHSATDMELQLKKQLSNLYSKPQTSSFKVVELPIVLKSDFSGSLEALDVELSYLNKDIENVQQRVKVIKQGVGGITQSDIALAESTKAKIVAFNLKISKDIVALAKSRKVEIIQSDIIYDIADSLKALLDEKIKPILPGSISGKAKILQVFSTSKITVAGCEVLTGAIRISDQIRILRNSAVIYTGSLTSLKQGKIDVEAIEAGQQCGMGFLDFKDFLADDVIECTPSK